MIASCKAQGTNSTISEENINMSEINFMGPDMKYEHHGDVDGSIHQYQMSKTNAYVVENGKTHYQILLSKDVSITLETAIKDFINLFKEATDIELEIVYDHQVDLDAHPFLSVGENQLFKQKNLQMDYEEIKSQGFIIKTIDQSIFFSGFSDEACMNSLYEYLHLIADFEFYGPDTYSMTTNIKEIPLMNYDIIDAPDIEYRVASYSFTNAISLRRYRLTNSGNLFMPVGGNNWHNTFNWLPKEEYEELHSEWYSDDGTQLCYTAHGNEKELIAMKEQVLSTLKDILKQYPTRTAITFTIQDSATFCTCDTCVKSKNKYNGSNSAVIVQFLNQVSNDIQAWFSTTEGAVYKRDLKILFFAYLETSNAPVRYDEHTDTYTAIDDSVICNDNVGVFFADIRGDYTHSYYDENSANANYSKNMRAWTACCKQLYFWTYSTNFHYYLTPYNSFDAMQDSYKFAVENNTRYLYDQAQFNQGSSATGWSFLKQYLTAKESWNVNINQNELIDDFFTYFYSKNASAIMKQLFDEYRVLANYQTEILGYSGALSIYHNPFKKEYWPKNTLLRWLDLFDDALMSIEPLKTKDAGAYAIAYSHITAERVAYEYLLLNIYSSSLSDEDLVFYKKQFHADAEENGMRYENELGTSLISDILK